jgi:hypothetical protein
MAGDLCSGAGVERSKKRGDAYIFTLPANCSFEMIAGARCAPVQKILEPVERFVVGGRGLRTAA